MAFWYASTSILKWQLRHMGLFFSLWTNECSEDVSTVSVYIQCKSPLLCWPLFRQTEHIDNEQGRFYQIYHFYDPGAGVLVLVHGNITCILMTMHFFFLKIFFSLLLGIDQINWAYTNDKQQRVFQNCTFDDPLGQRP